MAPTLCVILALAIAPAAARANPAADPPPSFAQTQDFKDQHERWAKVMADFEVPGMAIAVVKDGKIHGIETFGTCSAEKKQPPTPDTMYYIASITKTYLATAICAMADDGKLSLDDHVVKHLPRFKLADTSASNTITIRDLLCHKPGIHCEPVVTLDAFTGEITDDRYFAWLRTASPGERMGYSNIHFTLLGRVIEAITGKPWRDYLDERILRPAGLTRTTGYASRMYGDADHADPMEFEGGAWRACELRKTDRTMHAAGGLGASAVDAARWLILHVNDGEIDGKRIISAERAREMRTLASRHPEPQGSLRIMRGYGLGWQVGSFHGTPLCVHGGGYAGTSTYYAMLPEHKTGLVILMNASGAARGLGDVIAIDILDRLIDGDEHVDVMDAYTSRAADQKKQARQREATEAAPPVTAAALSRPLADYAGRYASDELGTLIISTRDDHLEVAFGECRLTTGTATDETDAFRSIGPAAGGQVFRFVVGDDGVKQITLKAPHRGKPVIFMRQ